MQRITLTEDLSFSRIVHGMWRLAEWDMSPQERLAFIESCIELGITTFDHADIYGGYTCEGLFGEALRLKPELRDQIEIVTKTGIKLTGDFNPGQAINHYDTTKTHIINQAERSLSELGIDHIDTLLIHRPDPLMNPDEVAEAFIALQESGKVRTFGVSNHLPSQQRLLQSRLPFKLVTNQLELSPMQLKHFEDGSVDLCHEERMPLMAWSPLAGGRLFSDDTYAPLRDKLKAIAERHGANGIDVIVYAWLLAHPARIMPIIGSGKIDRVERGVEALNIDLTREEWFEILKASRGRDVD
ncbi:MULTISPECIES: aldo/keto reductase [Exiguobacterium]|uniref:aldo/keto reductase n=1 Tax=Exiguobacterium TaxID=33986 RepID=UPI001BEB6305|nr:MULTISPECIES: aldo/keto reductase family oxidoreductase [Exiguobacterium]MCT4783609.1 aldo/keto reductase family oxidoreductase [Exiguobacterium himgiriensis]